jgi:hypothetical protein
MVYVCEMTKSSLAMLSMANKHGILYQGFKIVFGQFCNVAKLAIIHKKI